MENFVVSFRKYRPSTFDTVIGQSAITNTLKNAIKNNHLAQAFLFCGPRGVGKTTCARILAKTINCTNRNEHTEACNQCESCLAFNSSQSFNVHELDAASNNSVEDIRNLIEQVRFAPQIGKFSIYIIDEVHMLSTAAFNAFLKTLEEPPKHAIFILATTEKHKIIPTILSRCQIFDFKRITVEDIAQHLANIAQKENIIADPDALHIIAQKADGALRDALSIFDQIVSFCGNNITYQAVIENLNVLDYDYYFKLTDLIFENKVADALLLFNEILDKGFDGLNFIVGFSEHLRNLLICKTPDTVKLLEVSKNIQEKYLQQAQMLSAQYIFDCLKLTNETDVNYRTAKNKRLQVEICIIQLAQLNPLGEKKNDNNQHNIAAAPNNSSEKTQKTQQAIAPKQTAENQAIKPVNNLLKNTLPITSLKSSLTSLSKPIAENNNNPSEISANKTAKIFTYEQLLTAWQELCFLLEQEGKINLAMTLKNRQISIENNNITFDVDNVIQLEEINKEKTNILTILRQKLHNHHLQIAMKVVASQEKKIIYTPIDKYKHLVQKNPLLDQLRQKLDLDLDY